MTADFWGKFLLLTALFVVWTALPRGRFIVAGSLAVIGLDAAVDLPGRVLGGNTAGVATAFFFVALGALQGRWLLDEGRRRIAAAPARP